MPGGCCGGNGDAILAARQVFEHIPAERTHTQMAIQEPPVVLMEFTGDQVGAVTYTVNGRSYRGGNKPFDKYIDADPADVEKLVALGKLQVV